jgi:hypothetical protein
MARFYGEVGYGDSVETPEDSGVWVDVITEFPYQGDVIRNTRQLENTDKVNDDVIVSNSISIVADQYAIDHFFNIRYVRWAGVPWTVSTVEVRSPRLILNLGSVYNGPLPIPPEPEE